jgi:hypothetical protein
MAQLAGRLRAAADIGIRGSARDERKGHP